MEKYRTRAAWYFAVLMINAGFLFSGSKFLFSAFFSAFLYYFPSSLFWIFAGPWLFGKQFRSSSIFGIKAERFGFLIVCIGTFGAILFLFLGNEKLTATAIFAAMCGVDEVIWARECQQSAKQPEFRT
ncbi:hypothetical protein [Pandoraea pneumonica]|jgi:hypothetical protein|uniref:hypothetical protein n=1 Tax=Pandoraea pneumonica TaxID=2508299 RepID=UPI00123F62B9|nr:hypothetical protein [Pandoraea pneumonica]